jgi:hypothetical protein
MLVSLGQAGLATRGAENVEGPLGFPGGPSVT